MGTANGLIVEAELILSASSDVYGGCLLQPKDYHKNLAVLKVLESGVGRMYLFRLKQFVDPALMQYLIPYSLLADLASEWLIMIVKTMRGLYLVGLASHPILQALEVDALYAACTSTYAEERVSFGGSAVEAEAAEELVAGSLCEDAVFEDAVGGRAAEHVAVFHP